MGGTSTARNQPQAGPARTVSSQGHGHLPAPGQAPARGSNRDAVNPRLGPPDTGRGHSSTEPATGGTGSDCQPPGPRSPTSAGPSPGTRQRPRRSQSPTRTAGHGPRPQRTQTARAPSQDLTTTQPRPRQPRQRLPTAGLRQTGTERAPEPVTEQLGLGGPPQTIFRKQT